MLTTDERPALRLSFADERLAAEAQPGSGANRPWRVSNMELAKLVLEGDTRARRLCLWVDVLLLGSTPDEQAPLRLTLTSDAWSHGDAWPPCALQTALAPCLTGLPGELLSYTVSEVVPRDIAGPGEGFWHAYLESGAGASLGAPAASPQHTDVAQATDLLGALAAWMTETLGVHTVGGALRCVEFGEVGFFGPVTHRVLERSGGADLAADLSPLGEASDAPEPGVEASLRLELYGDRHGAWLLQRRRLVPQNKRRNEPGSTPLYDCDVLLAESAADLLQQAGLGRTEKKLFRAAGLLSHETLRDFYAQRAESADGAEGGEGAAAASVDLSTVPERSRRYVQALLVLAQSGKLSAPDLDVLLRTARQLARPVR
ncbi:MAG: hypothetical protein ACI87W_000783 [Halieaceae bacterium]|jgi:hypothetical protein